MEDLLALLRQALGNPTADFKPDQEAAIRSVLAPPRRSLVVEATGWGKSMVYFLATKVLRGRRLGPTLVISPLLSLMRDQLRAAQRLGLNAAQYTSENKEAWADIVRDLTDGHIDLLLVSPEQLANPKFQEFLGSTSLSRVGLLVIDEAHCISDWGHDFRPDYQRLSRLVRALPRTTAVLATTATANDRVVEDIKTQLGDDLQILRGSLARDSLRLQIIPDLSVAERLAWLSDHLNELPRSGIIYTLTTGEADRVADWLIRRGHKVLPYHAKLNEDIQTSQRLRQEREELLRRSEVKALVATIALGMGFDKPDLGFVVHHQSPGNLVAYYQQIGRAGRALDDAIAVLFLGGEDETIHEFFLARSRPPEDQIVAVIQSLEDGRKSERGLESALNLTRTEIRGILKLLSVQDPSPVVKVGPTFQLTPNPYQRDIQREEQIRARQRIERDRFLAFAQTRECLMMTVRADLDDPFAERCGRCANCTGREIVDTNINLATLQAAQAFLRQGEFPIKPRRQWVKGTLSVYGFSGMIPEELRCAKGLCLSHWGEAGTGAMVRDDKYAGRFRDELVEIAVEALRRQTHLPPVSWVTAVPSRKSLELVPDFAARLARAMGVPYIEAVAKVRDTHPQKEQRNSAHQTANLDGAFEVIRTQPGTALLVDDMVDSGWTFTIVGALLRSRGVDAVVPFALASTSNQREDE